MAGVAAVKDHIRAHGHIHALWMVAVLLAVIAALLLMLPNGDSVGNYISFAASIASLVLAVVAIGQALISNQGFSETVGTLKNSADNIESSSTMLRHLSSALHEKTDTMIAEFRALPPAFEQLNAKLDKAYATSERSTAGEDGDPDDPFTDYLPNGVRLALYAAGKAFQAGKSLNTNQLDLSVVWQTYISAALSAFKVANFKGMNISSTGGAYDIISIGSLKIEQLLSVFDNVNRSQMEQAIEQIDKHFGKS